MGVQTRSSLPAFRSWMNPELRGAWSQGFQGQNTSIIVVDDFRNVRLRGNLGPGSRLQTHGEWVRDHAWAVAPRARLFRFDWANSRFGITLNSGRNVLNASYAIMVRPRTSFWFSAMDRSIISHAHFGRAVVVKASGNYNTSILGTDSRGLTDYLNHALNGKQAAIFVGALDRNGTVTNPAVRARYSNFPGWDRSVQGRTVMVGVQERITGMPGTSFAAPVVSGYAAIIGSKFPRATPTQIVNQILATARRDTIRGYHPYWHGRGEASIGRALAPRTIR